MVLRSRTWRENMTTDDGQYVCTIRRHIDGPRVASSLWRLCRQCVNVSGCKQRFAHLADSAAMHSNVILCRRLILFVCSDGRKKRARRTPPYFALVLGNCGEYMFHVDETNAYDGDAQYVRVIASGYRTAICITWSKQCPITDMPSHTHLAWVRLTHFIPTQAIPPAWNLSHAFYFLFIFLEVNRNLLVICRHLYNIGNDWS